MPSRLVHGERWRPTPHQLTRLAFASLVLLIAIIPSGALVRLTDSGLGCPDWPGCHGEVIPPLSGHAWIEYTNRIFSAIVVLVAVATWIAAVRMRGAPRTLVRWAAMPAVAGLAQGPLGGLTVVFDLHPLLVACHFMLSVAALCGGVVVLLRARDHRDGRSRTPDPRATRLAGVSLIALFGVVVTGVLVTAAGPHSGDPAVIRRLGNLPDAAAVHVRFVIAFVIVAAVVAISMRRTLPTERLTCRLAVWFVPMLGVQIALGEYQYRNQLPWKVILVHVTVAGILIAWAVAIAWLTAHPPQSEAPDQPSARALQAANT